MIRAGARLALIALALSAAGAGAQRQFNLSPDGRRGMNMLPNADPSAIVAAEIAFGSLARTQGQWTAFRKTADKDAIMFVPGVVNAQAWLRKQANPPKPVSWAPDRIFISCDGSYAIAHGHVDYPDGRKGGYATLWRQDNGSYKWVLDWSTKAPTGSANEDGIDGKVADCPPRRMMAGGEMRGGGRGRPPKIPIVRIPVPPPASGEGQSADGSLHWAWASRPDGGRALKVTVRYQGALQTVIDDDFPAGAQ